MSDSDSLPKFVCWTCWTQVENFYNFHQRVHEAQANYLSDLSKYEQENNIVGVIDINTVNETQFDPAIKIEYDTSPRIFLCEESKQIEDEPPEQSEDEKIKMDSDEEIESRKQYCQIFLLTK